ncbi:MAG: homoserine dehydrogenase [Dethiobacteria bacterium]
MEQKEIQIGLLGMGTVGGGVVSLLRRNGEHIRTKNGVKLNIKKILIRDTSKVRAVDGLPSSIFTRDASEILQDPRIDIVTELIGGIEPAHQYMDEALRRGKYVVTANKDVMARFGAELLETAGENNKAIFFEASAGGGIPLIRPLQHCLSANRIERIMGIINGTTNYILTRMSFAGLELDQALREAQEKGFAEADPSNDLEGRDAAYKLIVLSGLAFGSFVHIDDVHIQGINKVAAQDLLYAHQLGYTIKLLAVGERVNDGLSLRVFPALLPLQHPLASVYNEFNALFVEGNAVGELMFYGKGAGALPTASAVVSDIIDAARCLTYGLKNGMPSIPLRDTRIVPGDEMCSSFYLRLQAQDRPGVFASVATAFGDEDVSLDMILQKRSDAGTAEIVLVTHDVREADFFRALDHISRMSPIGTINSVFRVLKKENGD